MVIDFKGVHYPKPMILFTVFFYVRYAMSYRGLDEIIAERGVVVDHATLNRWVVKFLTSIAANLQTRKRATVNSWRIDETYIKVRGKWTYPLACKRLQSNRREALSRRRPRSRRFFKQDNAEKGVPDRVIIDKSSAKLAGQMAVKAILKFTGKGHLVTICQVKYLNNIPEQDHRFIKWISALLNVVCIQAELWHRMMGLKANHSPAATIAGIEVAHMIRKDQFAALAA